MDINTIKITMLGVSGTGKTCYMAGMYGMMGLGQNLNGFRVSTSDKDDYQKLEEMNEIWSDMLSTTSSSRRWPVSTSEPKLYKFELGFANDNLRPIVEFDWYDYRGGAIQEYPPNSDDVNRLRERLRETSCILICVSGEHLNNSLKSTGSFLKACNSIGVNRINELIRESKSAGNSIPPSIAIVITKHDLCKHRTQDELLTIIKRMFPVLFENDSKWLVMLCPVTLGYSLAIDTEGEIDPQNIHLPIIFSLYSELLRKHWKEEENVRYTENQLENLKSSDIKRLLTRNEIKRIENDLDNLYSRADKIIEILQLLSKKIDIDSYIDIFYDGEKIKFSDFMK